jgi:hypothetical protein
MGSVRSSSDKWDTPRLGQILLLTVNSCRTLFAQTGVRTKRHAVERGLFTFCS